MTKERSGNEGATAKWLLAGLALWFGAVVAASATGAIGRLSPYAVPPLAFALMVLPALLFWRFDGVRGLVEEVGLRRLTALHGFRVLAVPLFFWYGGKGLLPRVFVNHAGWGDLISGVVALAVVALWARPAGYWVAHLVGMADFLIAFGTAMALTRENVGAMKGIGSLPMALIPFFFVGLLGSTHLMSYTILLRRRAGAGGRLVQAAVAR